jgi:hypothetical protein
VLGFIQLILLILLNMKTKKKLQKPQTGVYKRYFLFWDRRDGSTVRVDSELEWVRSEDGFGGRKNWTGFVEVSGQRVPCEIKHVAEPSLKFYALEFVQAVNEFATNEDPVVWLRLRPHHICSQCKLEFGGKTHWISTKIEGLSAPKGFEETPFRWKQDTRPFHGCWSIGLTAYEAERLPEEYSDIAKRFVKAWQCRFDWAVSRFWDNED